MKILVINAGSSSIKYKLFADSGTSLEASGMIERIGQSEGVHGHKTFSSNEPLASYTMDVIVPDHHTGMELIAAILTDSEKGTLSSTGDIAAVGHRVVHGGELFKEPTEINDDVLEAIRQNVPLAPLHNPANLTGIEVAMKVFTTARQVAVFDTAFHQTIPPHAYMYAVPYEFYEKDKVRRYGFHGTSHNYVTTEAAGFLGKNRDELKIISIHLGNGSSMAAVKYGLCVDTSMGLTPLAGLMMGTRCGDIDTAISFYLEREKGLTSGDLDRIYNKESGFLGLTGESDLRQVIERREAGDMKAALALGMLGYQIKKYIGSYMAVMGGCDVIVFTAGIGENSPLVRMLALAGLDGLGIELDMEKNKNHSGSVGIISEENSPVTVMVIATDEEKQIARESEIVCRALKH